MREFRYICFSANIGCVSAEQIVQARLLCARLSLYLPFSEYRMRLGRANRASPFALRSTFAIFAFQRILGCVSAEQIVQARLLCARLSLYLPFHEYRMRFASAWHKQSLALHSAFMHMWQLSRIVYPLLRIGWHRTNSGRHSAWQEGCVPAVQPRQDRPALHSHPFFEAKIFDDRKLRSCFKVVCLSHREEIGGMASRFQRRIAGLSDVKNASKTRDSPRWANKILKPVSENSAFSGLQEILNSF